MRSTRVPGSLIIALTMSSSVLAAQPATEDVLAKMESAQRSIDRFSCRFSTVQTMHTAFVRGAPASFRPLAPGEQRRVTRRECDIVVDRDKLRIETREARPERTLILRSSWDGKESRSYRVGAGQFNVRSQVDFFDARIWDPRTFAFDATPGQSRVDLLRSCLGRGELTTRTERLDGKEVIVLEGIGRADQSERGLRMWVSPARGYMPVRIEAYRGGRLVHRLVRIEHHEVRPAVWFPIAGVMEYLDKDVEGQVNSDQRMQVEVKSIELSPQITPATFTLDIPEGAQVIKDEQRSQRREARPAELSEFGR